MHRRVVTLLAAASLLVSISVAFAWRGPPAAAATSSTTLFMSTEAWYTEAPPCVSLIDCSTAPTASPYPKDTLHVSVAAGQETARTYLALALAPAPAPGARLVGGVLTLPIDAAAADGSLMPDQATLEACPVTQAFKPVRGSTAKPPAAKCAVSSPATYDAKTATFSVDLAPLASRWHGSGVALALVASKEARQPSATWHVVFHATTKPDKNAPPITATLVYTAPSSGSSTPPAKTPSTGGGSVSSVGSLVGGGSFSSSFPTPVTTTTTTTTTTVSQAPSSVLTAPPTSLEGFAGPGFAYPAVWALPLLFLAGIGALGRALTKELYRRGM